MSENIGNFMLLNFVSIPTIVQLDNEFVDVVVKNF